MVAIGEAHAVRYRVAVPLVYHERWLLIVLSIVSTFIMTADCHVHEETTFVHADMSDVRVLRGLGPPPHGVGEASMDRFRVPRRDAAMWAHLRAAAALTAVAIPASPLAVLSGAAAAPLSTTPGADLLRRGPRTTHWCLERNKKNAGGPLVWSGAPSRRRQPPVGRGPFTQAA